MMWPKRNPCLRLKKTNLGSLGEETNPHLATISFQGVVGSDTVPTFPSLTTQNMDLYELREKSTFAVCLPNSS